MSNTTTDTQEVETPEASYARTDVSYDLTDQQIADAQKSTPQAPASSVAAMPPPIKVKGKVMSAAAFIADAAAQDKNIAKALQEQGYDPTKGAQVLPKDKVPIRTDVRVVDYSKLDETSIYDDSIPMEAKPFAADDSLRIELRDGNYWPRWINLNPILLGKARSAGFTYITAEDLAAPLQIATEHDASGRFVHHDVVAMKIPKDIYFPALKAAHIRAVNTVNNLSSQKAARKQAMDLLRKEAGAGVSEEFEAGKVNFYTPGIEI